MPDSGCLSMIDIPGAEIIGGGDGEHLEALPSRRAVETTVNDP